MNLNLRLGKVAKVPLILSIDWLLFVIGFTLFTLVSSGKIVAFNSFLAIIAISAIVLLHEMGHMFMAKKFGARTKSITLHCFGGLAAINTNDWPKLLSKPSHSLLVWLAGPMINIVLAALLFAVFHPLGYASPLVGHPILIQYLSYLFEVNVVLALFNLLPVFPLDGGGCLLSILRMVMNKQKAIRITSIVGIIGSIGLILLAFKLKAIMLGFIGLMTLMASMQAPKQPLYK